MSGFAFWEWSIDGFGDDGEIVVDIDDRDLWAQANPALGLVRANGTGLSEDYIRDVERVAMTDDEFARERLGIFDARLEVDEEPAPEIDPEHWAACRDAPDETGEGGSRIAGPVCFAIEVPPERTWASICAAGARADGLVHGELVDRRPGTGWVVARMLQLRKRWRPRSTVLDPAAPAGALLADLVKAGIEVTPVTTREYAQACGDWFDDVVEHLFRHLGQPELDAAAAVVTKRAIGQAWGWERRHSDVDTTPLVGVTLAHWAHNQPVDRPPNIY